MESALSPAPWRAQLAGRENQDLLLVDAQSERIASVKRVEDAKALVLLPDLLDALDAVLEQFEWESSGGPQQEAYDRARALWRKARGE